MRITVLWNGRGLMAGTSLAVLCAGVSFGTSAAATPTAEESGAVALALPQLTAPYACIFGASNATAPWHSAVYVSSGTGAYGQSACGKFVVSAYRDAPNAPGVPAYLMGRTKLPYDVALTQDECARTSVEIELWSYVPGAKTPNEGWTMRARSAAGATWAPRTYYHPEGTCFASLGTAPTATGYTDAEPAVTQLRSIGRAFVLSPDGATRTAVPVEVTVDYASP